MKWERKVIGLPIVVIFRFIIRWRDARWVYPWYGFSLTDGTGGIVLRRYHEMVS